MHGGAWDSFAQEFCLRRKYDNLLTAWEKGGIGTSRTSGDTVVSRQWHGREIDAGRSSDGDAFVEARFSGKRGAAR